jgi:hypothetical protein
MPIWFELMILLLVTYGVGIGLGGLLWGRGIADDEGFEA